MKFFPSKKVDGFLHIVDGALGLFLVSGAATAIAIGQLMLSGILAALALGMFLRLKRGRVRK
ncbi:hypothetical protein [Variovorax paradoxus]|uniref:hypothetical protein n=1 Tax=Variovorax paradoxus TaxID=34073 RepID=UPI003D65A5A3